jgi:hypothetical protein
MKQKQVETKGHVDMTSNQPETLEIKILLLNFFKNLNNRLVVRENQQTGRYC